MTYRQHLKKVVPQGSLHFCELIVLDQSSGIRFWKTFDPSQGDFFTFLGVSPTDLESLILLAVLQEQLPDERESILSVVLLDLHGHIGPTVWEDRPGAVSRLLESLPRSGGDLLFRDWGLRTENGSEEYWRRCRRFIGKDLLFFPAAGAMVTDGAGRYLLQRRGDDGSWGILGGGLEIGETVPQAAVREVLEESGLTVRLTRLLSVGVGWESVVRYPNGDRLAFWGFLFLAEVVEGTVSPDGRETRELGWFSLGEIDELPNKNRYLQANYRNVENLRPQLSGWGMEDA